ncbi:MAG: nucleotidyl transferase AbiEii/AbiGii toxin family protein [Bacteroidales bacterium]
MLEINRHKFFLLQILKDIYSDIELATTLGFKGGTAMMFFYDLPRFSVDLDFNLIARDNQDLVYDKVRGILLKYGKIADEAKKFYSPVLVLDYGSGERKLKVEISNREFDNQYEIKNFLGINIMVMAEADMFAHKVCALLDRNALTNRDIFDSWFFMQRQTPISTRLVEARMQMPYADYIQKCIDRLEPLSDRGMLQGLGELMDPEIKTFVKTKLREEVISLFRFYKEFPV